jgi:EAL and modified HD-GYP domain-containing signal transduction protein
MFAHHKKVESIRYAVVMLGLKAMKQFAMVLAMSNINDKPHELLVTALLRARMCELLAVQRNDLTRETLFTVGLLSVLDALLDMQMDELLASLSMADEINAALLTREGEAGAVLECVIAYEQGRWDDAAVGIFDPDQLHNAYFEAVSWSDAVAAEISQPA